MSHKMWYRLGFVFLNKYSARKLYSGKPVPAHYDLVSISDHCTWNFAPELGKNELSVTSKINLKVLRSIFSKLLSSFNILVNTDLRQKILILTCTFLCFTVQQSIPQSSKSHL